MLDERGSALPVSRSFVVQFADDTAPDRQRYRGRVEHIESGRSERFRSLEDLLGFIAAVLGADGAT